MYNVGATTGTTACAETGDAATATGADTSSVQEE